MSYRRTTISHIAAEAEGLVDESFPTISVERRQKELAPMYGRKVELEGRVDYPLAPHFKKSTWLSVLNDLSSWTIPTSYLCGYEIQMNDMPKDDEIPLRIKLVHNPASSLLEENYGALASASIQVQIALTESSSAYRTRNWFAEKLGVPVTYDIELNWGQFEDYEARRSVDATFGEVADKILEINEKIEELKAFAGRVLIQGELGQPNWYAGYPLIQVDHVELLADHDRVCSHDLFEANRLMLSYMGHVIVKSNGL